MKKVLNRSWFVGVGAYRDTPSVLLEDNESNIKALKEFCKDAPSNIGVFYGDKGIYIEPCLIISETQTTLETLKGCYTKEECFYSAEIIGSDLVCRNSPKELYEYLLRTVETLNKYEGFTLKIIDGYVYRLITVEGELFS